ncbi:MAG: alkaline serine exoprotease precursor [Myxococcales bacterium]|nr:alkaline serine exoprotease precursor [Myxococcales bacterium]
MKRVLAIVIVCGCASGKSSGITDASIGQPVDAKEFLDGQIEPQQDAAQHPDAMTDARPLDAFVFLDACVPQVTELLMNPVLDLAPAGVGWAQVPSDPTYPPITSDGAFAPHTAPYKMWLGGLIAPAGTNVTSFVYQDVTIPAGTTQLVMTGYHVVGTEETATTAFDTATVAVTQVNGTPIESVEALSNLTNTGTAWAPFNHTFTSNLSGQTVRLRFTSTNDDSLNTNFFFDTLSLKATHCP